MRLLAALLVALPLAAQLPSLTIEAGPFVGLMSPRERGRFDVTVRNRSAVPATNGTVTVTLPTGGSILDFTAREGRDVSCSLADQVLTCAFPRLTSDEPVRLEVNTTAPDRVEGSPFSLQVSVRAAEEDLDPLDNDRTFYIFMKRELLVTNTGDAGDGSLRQAMLDANTLCLRRTPCNITFHISAPVPAGGRFVIQPRTPLPELMGEIRVDGASQTAFTGDSDPNGPEIEINGALQPQGSGIRVSPNCTGEIYDLAVTGFPGYGIDVSRMPGDPGPEVCYVNGPTLRVTIARNHLTGNFRGLGLRTFYSTVESNVIRGNRRSGIFAADGTIAVIRDNRIESNGASGMFLNVGSAQVQRNVIAGNAEWAVARTGRGDVLVNANAMFGNGLEAIDIGLDRATPANRPVLFWAIYDATKNATVVRGRFDAVNPPVYRRFFIEVFTSAALSRENAPQAEEPLIEHEVTDHADFEIAIPGDLRGKWITAVSHTVRFEFFARGPRAESNFLGAPTNTSELSNAVFVAD